MTCLSDSIKQFSDNFQIIYRVSNCFSKNKGKFPIQFYVISEDGLKIDREMFNLYKSGRLEGRLEKLRNTKVYCCKCKNELKG
jgi:hypothetical protein